MARTRWLLLILLGEVLVIVLVVAGWWFASSPPWSWAPEKMAQEPIRGEGLALVHAKILAWHRGHSGDSEDDAILLLECRRSSAEVWVLTEVFHFHGKVNATWHEMFIFDDSTTFYREFDHRPTDKEVGTFMNDIRWK